MICRNYELICYSNFDNLQFALSLYPIFKEILKNEATITHRGRYIGKRQKRLLRWGCCGHCTNEVCGYSLLNVVLIILIHKFHTLAADHESVNLDTWMASNTHVQHLYNKYGDGADVCVTEGVMGLFDGYQRMQGSSAEIARLLNIPVVLIVSARSTAYSVAPLIYGFKHFNPAVKIAGIVFNQVSSPSHFAYLREACVDAGVECLGYLPMTEGLKIPSRHLGLTLTAKRSMNTLIEQAAELVGKYVDLDKLLSICHRKFPVSVYIAL